MPIAIAAILVVLGLVGAAAVFIGAPVLLGFMAYDSVKSRRSDSTSEAVDEAQSWDLSQEAAQRRIYIERGVARAFVITGGVFWSAAAFAGLYSFLDTGASSAFMAAAIPAFATAVTLVIGWYWERFTAAMLTLASLAVVYYGVITQFEAGVWMLVTVSLIGPMMTAAVLFWMARREYEAFQLRVAQLELATAKVSSY